MEEINQYKKVYYIGHKCKKINRDNKQLNSGYDDDKGEYLFQIFDHIGYRYEIVEVLGKGSFG